MNKFSLIAATATIAVAASVQSCGKADASTTPAPRGVDRANLDTTYTPGQDFYQYACGGWMKANPLSAEYSRYGTFDQLGELNERQIHDLVTGINADTATAGSNAQKIADLYALGMDSVRLNAEQAKPIAADLATIAAAESNFTKILAQMPALSAFFNAGVDADMIDSNRNVIYWVQGGTGLGDRDYYIEDSEATLPVREAYRTYLHKLATLSGYSEADADRLVENTMRIETTLAQAAMSLEERRDPFASYNPMALADVESKYPAIGLTEYFATMGLTGIDTLIVGQPRSLEAVNKILSNEPTQALRDYMSACYMRAAAPYLSDDFIDANFELQKVMSGVEQMKPRWKRAVAVPNGVLGEALGQLYVAQYFPPESKEKMLTLVENLRTALGQHIDALTWMSPETKARAQEKLAAFTVKIGYPDKWRDYSALDISRDKSYWENIMAASLFNRDYENSQYGKPVDRDRWYMTPQTVNAYYNPGTNEICFPAGILQAPYFNPNADDAENYGAIGVVIGHEMTHGFDDQGRQFDKDGNLSNWWTEADAAAFNALADRLVAQFDEIIVAGDTHANGRFTLGENIADQGGLRVAYTAYHNSLGDSEGEVIDGFTPDQRFYLAYANVWAGNIREAEILKRTKTDPHSLGRWRVNATLRNIEPFFEAFGITEGDAMYRPAEERVVIW